MITDILLLPGRIVFCLASWFLHFFIAVFLATSRLISRAESARKVDRGHRSRGAKRGRSALEFELEGYISVVLAIGHLWYYTRRRIPSKVPRYPEGLGVRPHDLHRDDLIEFTPNMHYDSTCSL